MLCRAATYTQTQVFGYMYFKTGICPNLLPKCCSSLETRPFPLAKHYALFDVYGGQEICQERGYGNSSHSVVYWIQVTLFCQALKGWFRGLVRVQALTLAYSILLFMKQPEADR